MPDADAIVIGAGPNGLVAANLLADRGWDVLVLEAQPEPGGAVRSAELVEPGFTSDVFSGFYPLAAGSPVFRRLELERHGLRWLRSEVAFAHPHSDGRCAAVHLDLDRTCENLESFAPGDGEAWRELYALWERAGGRLLDALTTPFPPLRAGARLAARLGARELLPFLRFALLPVRRMADERFRGEGGAWLLGGNALHTDFTPDLNGSGLFGWLLGGLAQQLGFPVPEGGAGRLAEALAARLRSRGGRLECGERVERVLVRGGHAHGVGTAGGRSLTAARAVLAGTTAQSLLVELLPRDLVPERILRRLDRFHWDSGTVKVDWTLERPIPWTAEEARRAATVHVGDGLDSLMDAATPFLVMGQYSMVDRSRAPAGKEVAWAYTHVPRDSGPWHERRTAGFADRVEEQVERRAPGFRDSIRARHVLTPDNFAERDENLARGSMNAGTSQIHQQLVFRPYPGLGRPETPVRGLYLCSAAAHPGGGVHGGPGANAARAALAHARLPSLRREPGPVAPVADQLRPSGGRR